MTPSRETNSDATTLLILIFPLSDDPEGHVGHVWIFYYPSLLEFDVLRPEMVEQPDPIPEQHRNQVYMYHVQEPCPQALLDDARRANRHVLLPGRRPGLFDRALYALRHESER